MRLLRRNCTIHPLVEVEGLLHLIVLDADSVHTCTHACCVEVSLKERNLDRNCSLGNQKCVEIDSLILVSCVDQVIFPGFSSVSKGHWVKQDSLVLGLIWIGVGGRCEHVPDRALDPSWRVFELHLCRSRPGHHSKLQTSDVLTPASIIRHLNIKTACIIAIKGDLFRPNSTSILHQVRLLMSWIRHIGAVNDEAADTIFRILLELKTTDPIVVRAHLVIRVPVASIQVFSGLSCPDVEKAAYKLDAVAPFPQHLSPSTGKLMGLITRPPLEGALIRTVVPLSVESNSTEGEMGEGRILFSQAKDPFAFIRTSKGDQVVFSLVTFATVHFLKQDIEQDKLEEVTHARVNLNLNIVIFVALSYALI